MTINGLLKLTLLDFPGKTACTVFVGGCNFRCPFCHNASLVLRAEKQPTISEDEFFAFLEKRKGRLDGVCITGGEPTLQNGMQDFLAKIKDSGFEVKLDTNGYRPDILKKIIDEGLADYVAMDIKSSKSGYSKLVGIPNIDLSPICESIDFLFEGNVPFEFRTTAVKGLHSLEDFEEIGEWIKGAPRYFIQCYKDSGDVIDNSFSPFSKEELLKLLDSVKKNVPSAELRGVD